MPWVKCWYAFLLVVGSKNDPYTVLLTASIFIYIGLRKLFEFVKLNDFLNILKSSWDRLNIKNFTAGAILVFLIIQAFTDSYVQEADYVADTVVLAATIA